MIPNKIYNDDGSPYVYHKHEPSDQTHPFAALCVLYDKKTDTYYSMSELRPGYANSFKFDRSYGQSFTSTSTKDTYHIDNIRHLLEAYVKQSGIQIQDELPDTYERTSSDPSCAHGSGPADGRCNGQNAAIQQNMESWELRDGRYVSPWTSWAEKYIEDQESTQGLINKTGVRLEYE